MADEPDEAEIERIHEEAAEKAAHHWHASIPVVNPYKGDPWREEIWRFAFRQAFARENS